MRPIMMQRHDVEALENRKLRKELLELMDSVECDYLVNGDDMEQFLQEDFMELLGVHRDQCGYDLLLRHMDWKALAQELMTDFSMEETSDGQQWWFQG